MIKITNNKETKVVTKGAYNSFYKPLGFKIVETNKMSTKIENKSETKPVKDLNDKENFGTQKTAEKTNTKRK